MQATALTLAAILTLAAGPATADEKRRHRDQRTYKTLKARAQHLPKPAASDRLDTFLAAETRRLIERSSQFQPGAYKFNRMMEALDDLLDAREDILDARRKTAAGSKDKHDDSRTDTARRLERAYFRVQQGDYFGKLSADPHAPEYILRSRQLYQKARSAYDRQEYRKASKLASASTELVNVLENLAQAAVRKPDPPVLE